MPENDTLVKAVSAVMVATLRFFSTTAALRELSDVLTPVAAQLDSFETRLNAALTRHGIASLPPEQRASIAATATELDAISKDRGALKRRETSGTEAAEERARLQTRERHALAQLIEAFGDAAAASHYLNEFSSELYRVPRRLVVLNSMLTSAVAAFESTVGEVVLQCQKAHPKMLASTEKEFSLDDLERYESLEEVRRETLTRRVDELLRRGMDEWRDWFLKRLKVDMHDFAIDWNSVVEVFQRRHLLVHHGGRVSQQYLQKVSARPADLKQGTVLRTTRAYVQESIDHLSAVGILLGCAVALKLDTKARPYVGNELLDVVYELMEADRWQPVLVLCREGQRLGLSDGDTLILRVNHWLALKRLGRIEEARPAVASWDCTPLARRFVLAKLALLDDDALIDEARACLEAGQITSTDVARWPLLRELREHPRFSTDLADVLADPRDREPAALPERADAQT